MCRRDRRPSHGDTTYFTTADKDGMLVSIIHIEFSRHGCRGLWRTGLGFMFQDRGQLFSLQDGHPNIYAPGKRPFQTIIPGFASKDGVPWLSFGVMGGDMQPQGQTQIILNRVDYGLDVQSAADSPRWHHEGSSQSMSEDRQGMGPARGAAIGSRAFRLRRGRRLGRSGLDAGARATADSAAYECIEMRKQGADRVYAAGSEMRADAVALAY